MRVILYWCRGYLEISESYSIRLLSLCNSDSSNHNRGRRYKCRLCGQLHFVNEFVSHLHSVHAIRADILESERGFVEALFVPNDN
jgi:hypothetical protein